MSNEVWIALITGGFTLAGIGLSGLFRFGEQRRQAKREQLDKAMQNLLFFYSYEKVLLVELAKCTGKAAVTLKKELRLLAGPMPPRRPSVRHGCGTIW